MEASGRTRKGILRIVLPRESMEDAMGIPIARQGSLGNVRTGGRGGLGDARSDLNDVPVMIGGRGGLGNAREKGASAGRRSSAHTSVGASVGVAAVGAETGNDFQKLGSGGRLLRVVRKQQVSIFNGKGSVLGFVRDGEYDAFWLGKTILLALLFLSCFGIFLTLTLIVTTTQFDKNMMANSPQAP
ncbi:unnamed protein product [Ilex paraguariensis]|uniref:Uncharacterized protein n=1 Tax=Ilex paraguariensis TaxID=185542 RepID=A0ABC8UB92_9AQUA